MSLSGNDIPVKFCHHYNAGVAEIKSVMREGRLIINIMHNHKPTHAMDGYDRFEQIFRLYECAHKIFGEQKWRSSHIPLEQAFYGALKAAIKIDKDMFQFICQKGDFKQSPFEFLDKINRLRFFYQLDQDLNDGYISLANSTFHLTTPDEDPIRVENGRMSECLKRKHPTAFPGTPQFNPFEAPPDQSRTRTEVLNNQRQRVSPNFQVTFPAVGGIDLGRTNFMHGRRDSVASEKYTHSPQRPAVNLRTVENRNNENAKPKPKPRQNLIPPRSDSNTREQNDKPPPVIDLSEGSEQPPVRPNLSTILHGDRGRPRAIHPRKDGKSEQASKDNLKKPLTRGHDKGRKRDKRSLHSRKTDESNSENSEMLNLPSKQTSTAPQQTADRRLEQMVRDPANKPFLAKTSQQDVPVPNPTEPAKAQTPSSEQNSAKSPAMKVAPKPMAISFLISSQGDLEGPPDNKGDT